MVACYIANASSPSVKVSVWAIGAYPRCVQMALRLDDSAAKVSIIGMVPQALDATAEEADIWSSLLLVRHALAVIADTSQHPS